MPPQTERYLDLARRGENQWWRYTLGAAIILFCWLVLGVAPFALLAPGEPPDALLEYIVVNFGIVAMLGGLFVAVQLVHRRPLLTLITPDRRIDWKRVAQGAAAWGVIALVIVIVEHLLYPGRYYLSFSAERFFPFAAVALALTPVQTTTEELVFRGYVMQGVGLLVRRPLVIAVASSLVFTVPHLLNPEMRYGTLIMAANYFTIGMLLATVALRDGRLELAIGIHAVNNLLLALLASYEGSALPAEAVFTARELDPVYSLATLAVGAVVFYRLFFGRGDAAAAHGA